MFLRRRIAVTLVAITALGAATLGCGERTDQATDHPSSADATMHASPETTSTTPTPTSAAPVAAAPEAVGSTTTIEPEGPAPTGPAAEMQLEPKYDAPPPPSPQLAPPTPTVPSATLAAAGEVTCAIMLHGKGGGGAATTVSADGIVHLSPSGNASGWGGRQWVYFTAADRASATAIIRAAIEGAGCGRVAIHGFSNGAAFLAALYCASESFGGRLRLTIIDDPVTDHAVEGCTPAPEVAVALYWTGALAGQAPAGWDCAIADWTCSGGTSMGIDGYAAALHASVRRSPMGAHTPYLDAPELRVFGAG